MFFDGNLSTLPYDPDRHSICTSYLKDCGSYYQINVCKFLSSGSRRDKDAEKLDYLVNEQGLSMSEAKDFIFYNSIGRLDLLWKKWENEYHESEDMEDAPADIERFINNLYRAKSTIRQLGECNDWDYFVTFTIDPAKHDRNDFKAFYKVFSKFKNNYKRDYGCKFRHVFVPEQHADGAWHLHGLIGDLPESHLKEYHRKDFYPYTETMLPKYILDKLHTGQRVFSWTAFAERFGFTVVEEIKDKSRASSYITKYIGKGFANTALEKGLRLVLPSLGLKRAEQLKKGHVRIADVQPSYDCDYATTFKFYKDTYSLEDVLSYFQA